jgi:hypothetical protein
MIQFNDDIFFNFQFFSQRSVAPKTRKSNTEYRIVYREMPCQEKEHQWNERRVAIAHHKLNIITELTGKKRKLNKTKIIIILWKMNSRHKNITKNTFRKTDNLFQCYGFGAFGA